jgi:hypothetical protein
MQILLLFTLYAGLYQLGTVLLRIPSRRSELVLTRAVAEKKTTSDVIYNILIRPFVDPIANLIPLSLKTQIELEMQLRQVNINLTAKQYYAKAVIYAIFAFVVTALLVLLQITPVFIPLLFIMPILIFKHYSTEHETAFKRKQQQISMHLATFVRSIHYSLSDINDNATGEVVGRVDLIKVFSDYYEVAPEIMQNDVSMLVSEMRTLSVEKGLRNFADRMANDKVTYLFNNILINVSKGTNQGVAMSMFAQDIDTYSREAIRKELNTVPGKMRRAIVIMALISVAAIIYTVVVDLISSMGHIF